MRTHVLHRHPRLVQAEDLSIVQGIHMHIYRNTCAYPTFTPSSDSVVRDGLGECDILESSLNLIPLKGREGTTYRRQIPERASDTQRSEPLE